MFGWISYIYNPTETKYNIYETAHAQNTNAYTIEMCLLVRSYKIQEYGM